MTRPGGPYPPVRSAPMIGDRVGPYLLLEVAGEGGMGIVYRAADTLLHDRTVAVKVMAAHLSAEPAYRAAFLHEAQVAAEVSHPNVVPVHAAGEADGLLYLAMAWIDGPNLREIGALSITRAITLVRQVARAIDALHEAGIVHGDIKPSNILVHREDHAYLVDFGVARRSEYADARTSELVGGTPAYAAPETTDSVPNPASDLYALGCVVFELLTGERPFGSGDARVLAARHATAPRPLVSDIAPDLAVFDDVVARAIARDPAERYASGAEFARALERAERTVAESTTRVMMRPATPARSEPATPTRDPDPAERGARRGGGRRGSRGARERGDAPPRPARLPVEAAPPEPPRRHRGALAAVALVALLAAAFAIGYVVTNSGGDDLAARQRAADTRVVTRLVRNYADALSTGDLDKLARTVSPEVVRKGSDGEDNCARDTGSREALARWAAQIDDLQGYQLQRIKVTLDGTTAQVTAQGTLAGPIRFNAALEDGVWRITRVTAPPC